MTCFFGDPSCHIKTPTRIFYKEVYKRQWYRKGLLIVLEEFCDEYLQMSHEGYSALTWHHEHNPQEPWRSRWLQEKDTKQSASTHVHHAHCAPSQLGTTANQRYGVSRDWLWDVCQLARVCWGTHCRGFCSKEGLHYCIEWSTRNPLERDQVQRALGKLSRSCHQTNNNEPWYTVWKSLGDSLPKLYCVDLAKAYVTQESVSLRILGENKRYDLQLPNGRLHEKPSAKGRTGKENWYWFLEPGSHEHLPLRRRVMYARNMEAQVQLN
jgi:hypothetical protein